MNKPKLIGLSFSRCMSDLLSGKVKIEQVKKLITGTKCPTESEFIELIHDYKQLGYWRRYTAEEAIEIYHKIKHLIWQPRLENKGYPFCGGDSKWVTDKTQITWFSNENH